MAADTTLTVGIGVEMDDLSNGLKNAKGELIDFSKSIGSLKDDLKGFEKALKAAADPKEILVLNKSIDETKKKISDIKKAGISSGGALGKDLTKGSDQAAFALTNLGRVAQDAPFGFIGIQNNLNPLLESFQQLRKESGSNVSALKALGQSLIGPAGIGLALSLVSAGVLLYQKYISGAAKETEKAAKENENYADSLKGVEQSRLKGTQNAQKELTHLNTLFNAYTNANLPLKKRQEAYAELQRLYPEYFGNLKFEKEATDKTKKAYDKLSASILATAKARAAEDLITKNETKRLINISKINAIEKDRPSLIKAAVNAKKALEESQKLEGNRGAINLRAIQRQASAQLAVEESIGSTNELHEENNKLTAENLELVKSVTTEIEKGADLFEKVGKGGGEEESIKNKIKDLKELQSIGQQTDLDKALGIGRTPLLDVPELKLPEVDTSAFEKSLAKAKEKSAAELQALKDKSVELSLEIGGELSAGLAGIGASIGTALAEGTNVFAAIGETLFSAIGSIVTKLGEAAIAIGVGMIAIKESFKNPFTAIAAGIALVALGAFINKSVAKIPQGGESSQSTTQRGPGNVRQFAGGVTNFSGGMALVGERGPELVTLGRGSNVITNENVSRFMNGNRQQPIVLSSKVGIEAGQLRVWLERDEKLNRRTV